MSRHKLYHIHPKSVRDSLNQAVDVAETFKTCESDLIDQLVHIEKQRLYTRYGFKSIRGFCITGLGFGRTQAQRIATIVRRKTILQPTHYANGQHRAQEHQQEFNLIDN